MERKYTKEQKIKLAGKLKELNLDINQISEIIELSVEEIEEIFKSFE